MKKFKRLAACALSMVMAIGTLPSAMAEGEIVYAYENDSQAIVNVTESDLSAGNWNADYMSKLPVEPYEDFPMALEKNVYGMAQLRIFATYLKNVREGETVTLSVVNRDTNEVFYSKDITTEDSSITIKDIPMNKTFNMVLSSEYNGAETKYQAVIRTYYGEAVMPEYVSLTDNTTDSSEIRIKDLTLGNTYTEDENGEQVLNRNISFIEAAQLKDTYAAINDNHLYNVQTNNDGNLYKGYMSKAAKYGCDYVFAPMYDYYLEDDYLAAMSRPQTLEVEIPEEIMSGVVLDGVYSIDNQMDHHVLLTEDVPAKGFMLEMDYTGEYSIKGYSNTRYTLYYAAGETNDIDSSTLTWHEIADVSQVKRISYADNQNLFIICYAYKNWPADIVLNVCYNDEDDDVDNFINSVNVANTFTLMDTELSHAIDYAGDVDVFMLNCSYAGKYSFVFQSLQPREDLIIETYSLGTDNITYFIDEEALIEPGERVVADFGLLATSTVRYFAVVRAADPLQLTSGDYKVEFRTRAYVDPYEGNDVPGQATDLSTLTSPLRDAAIGRADWDYYTFSAGPGGAEVLFEMSSSCTTMRDLFLYSDDSDFEVTGVDIGGLSTIETTVPENETFFLMVRSTGNSAYCTGHPYVLGWRITQLNPYTVTFNNDVTYEMTAGTTDPTELLMVVAQATTCINNDSGATINTMTKMNNLKLFYMNGTVETEITETTISSIPAGTYTLTAELYGTPLTGKTITLVVS